MSNKCPMCGQCEDEHSEVLKVLAPFEDRREAAEAVLKVCGLATGEDPKKWARWAAEEIAASDLYRKLKTR